MLFAMPGPMQHLRIWTTGFLGPLITLVLLAAASQSHAQEFTSAEGLRYGMAAGLTPQDREAVPEAPRLRLERSAGDELTLEQARDEYRQLGLGGPIVLMALSFHVAIPVTLIGLIMSAVNNDVGPLMGGLSCFAVSIGAGVWLGQRVRARRVISTRIRELEREHGQLSRVTVGLTVHPEHGSLSLGMRF